MLLKDSLIGFCGMALNKESNLINGLALGLDNRGVRNRSVSLW